MGPPESCPVCGSQKIRPVLVKHAEAGANADTHALSFRCERGHSFLIDSAEEPKKQRFSREVYGPFMVQ